MNFKNLISLLVIILATVSAFPDKHCREPDYNELLRKLKSPDSETLPPSFLLLPYFRNVTGEKSPRDGEVKIRFRGEPGCHNDKGGGNICPSYHVVQYDPDRVPSTIIQAECSCHQCQHLHRHSSMKYRCQKVFSYSRVLRKAGCKVNPDTMDSVMQYTKSWEPVSIACTCVIQN